MNGQTLTLLAMSLSNAKAVVTPSILEEVLEALYLNPAAIGAQNQLAENFVLLVKKLAEQGLIQHVPSRVAVEEKKEEKKEEKEEEKGEETLDPKVKEQFEKLIESNVVGEELFNKAVEENIPKDTRSVGEEV